MQELEAFVNGSFENGWTGWTYNATERSEAEAHTGNWSMRGYFTTGWIQQLFSEPYPLKEEVTVLEYWTKLVTGASTLQVIFNNGTLSAGMSRSVGAGWVKTNILTRAEWINNIPTGATIEGVKFNVGVVVVFADDFVCTYEEWVFDSWLDRYFMFSIGIAGLVLMVFAPTWVAFGLRKNPFQPEKVERIGTALLLFIIGYCLVMAWLWS